MSKSLHVFHFENIWDTCPEFLLMVARSFRRAWSYEPEPSSKSNLVRSNSLKSSSNEACSFLALWLERSRLNSYNNTTLVMRITTKIKELKVEEKMWWWIMAPEHLLQNKNTNALRGKTYSCNSPNASKYMLLGGTHYCSNHFSLKLIF